jgi:hypothetical protein
MSGPRRIPASLFQVSAIVAFFITIVAAGYGLGAWAADRSTWPEVAIAVGAFAPFATLAWLRRTGRIETFDDSPTERRLVGQIIWGLMSIAPRLTLALWFALIVAGILYPAAYPFLKAPILRWMSRFDAEVSLPLLGAQRSGLELLGWALGLGGIGGAVVIWIQATRDDAAALAKRARTSRGGKRGPAAP